MTHLMLLLACKGDDPKPDEPDTITGNVQTIPGDIEVQVVQSTVITTVPTITWEHADVTEATIEWGLTQDYGNTTQVDLTDAPFYSTSVLGLKPGQEHHLRVVADTAQGTLSSGDIEITTGYPPNSLPTLTVEKNTSTTGGYFVTSFVQDGAVIFDADGEVVWWYTPNGATNLGRVTLSADRKWVTMGEINLQRNKRSELVRVSVDGTQEERIDAPYRHHDFVEHEDGTYAMLTYDPQEIKGNEVPGDSIVEHTPDGDTSVVWTIWDYHTFDGGGGGNIGWPHANAIDYLPDEDAYLVSSLDLKGIIKIDRKTSNEEWILGGGLSTIQTSSGSTEFFDGQHGMDQVDGGLVVFENGRDGRSRAVEVSVNESAKTAEEVWSYEPSPPMNTPVLGDVQHLPSGNTLVTFSYNGQVDEVDASGQLLWRVTASLGGAVGYMTWVDHL